MAKMKFIFIKILSLAIVKIVKIAINIVVFCIYQTNKVELAIWSNLDLIWTLFKS